MAMVQNPDADSLHWMFYEQQHDIIRSQAIAEKVVMRLYLDACPSYKSDRVDLFDFSPRPLALENLALRQPVALLKRSVKRLRVTRIDRLFWVAFARYVDHWKSMLHVLHPGTVVRWHREEFRRYWTRKNRRVGRPPVEGELGTLIRTMQAENLTWGASRIHGELIKLGFNLSEASGSKYMKTYPKPPSQSWRVFLVNHADSIAAVDFFTVPTVTFRVWCVFIVTLMPD
jgi:hypothetical protein